MYVLKHHHNTINLKNCKNFKTGGFFAELDVTEGGTKPTNIKRDAFSKLEKPKTWGGLQVLIGIFGFYRTPPPHKNW